MSEEHITQTWDSKGPTRESTLAASNPTRQELIARAREIAPTFERTAADSERLRTLCPEAVTALVDSGLLGLWSPPEVGGFDADYVTQVDVMIELARADMSGCWTMMIGASVTALLACGLSEQGLREVFDGARLPAGAAALKVSGKAERVEGGYHVNGSWGFGSGIHHSTWIMANCLVTENGKRTDPLETRRLAIPIDQVEIIDDWYVSGLRGTGSSSYKVEGVFVPEHRVSQEPPLRGSAHNCNMTPRLPLEHASVSLGGARHALDEVIHQAVSKKRLMDPNTVASKQAFQLELGKLEAQWEALRAGVRNAADDLCRALADNAPKAPFLTDRLRAVCALAAEQSLDIGNRALRYAGAGAVLESNVMQRIHRDLTVSAQHFMISDISYELYGRSKLGLDLD
jgi:alkylation response protein AidB-like acyl-CoA dehydrogenase